MNLELKNKVNCILEEMKRVYLNDSRPWVIGYSGGKDSTAVVQLVFMMLERLAPCERNKDVYVVSSDTLIENPIVLGFLQQNSIFINDGARAKGLPLYTYLLHPDYNDTYWTNIIGKGLPTPTSIRFRWCTERLKIKPSNKFIEEKVKENGEVVILLGVRKSESIARGIRIKNREIDGYILTPHETLNNTYVYNPIVDLSTREVWDILLDNNGRTPWGTSNHDLNNLYRGADKESDGGECPFTVTNDKDTPSCGNSRFGCWICTVVNEDKSLTGFISNGETYLQPLLDFRTWILSIRNKHEFRLTYRRDGNHYYKKIYLNKLPLLDNMSIAPNHIFQNESGEYYVDLKISIDQIQNGAHHTTSDKDKIYLELLPLNDALEIIPSKIQSDDKGSYVNVLGYGPFTFEARQLILKKLLETQKIMNENIDIELITKEELEVIDSLWDKEQDLTCRTLVNLYNDVMEEKLPWDEYKKPIFDNTTLKLLKDLCVEDNIDENLVTRLLIETHNFKYFNNKVHLDKAIDKILNQKHLHKTLIEEV